VFNTRSLDPTPVGAVPFGVITILAGGVMRCGYKRRRWRFPETVQAHFGLKPESSVGLRPTVFANGLKRARPPARQDCGGKREKREGPVLQGRGVARRLAVTRWQAWFTTPGPWRIGPFR